MPRTRFDRLIDAVGVLAGFLLCALVVLVCADVAARYTKLFPIPWAFEVAQYMLYATTFLGAPWVLRERGHISVDIAVDLLPARARAGLERITNVLGTAVCVVLLYLFVRLAIRSWSQGTMVYETLIFPEWILFTVAPVAFLLLVALFVRALARRPDASRREIGTDGI